MMRKGPLDRYPAGSVLREAASGRVDGSIEFHGPHPMTVYFAGGAIYCAHDGVGRYEQGWSEDELASEVGDEAQDLADAVRLIAIVLTQREGWYYHHPLHHHPRQSPWSWETAHLVRLARDQHRTGQPIARWATGAVRLDADETPRSPFPADAWEVVVAMTRPTDTALLRERLGWDPDRLASALDHLEAMGVALLPGTPASEPAPRLGRGLPPPDSTVVPFLDRAARLAALPPASTRPPVSPVARDALPPPAIRSVPVPVPVPVPSSEPLPVPGPLTPAFARSIPPDLPAPPDPAGAPSKVRRLNRRRKPADAGPSTTRDPS